MTHTYKKANIIVVFVEIFLRARYVLALNTVFDKLGFQDNFSIIECSMHSSSAPKKISSNKTIMLAFYTFESQSQDLQSSETYFFTFIYNTGNM